MFHVCVQRGDKKNLTKKFWELNGPNGGAQPEPPDAACSASFLYDTYSIFFKKKILYHQLPQI